jgi:hypothetical protein
LPLPWLQAQRQKVPTPSAEKSDNTEEPDAYFLSDVITHDEGMKIFNLIHVTAAQAFYRWALREIDPLHPDLPRILLRQQALADKERRLWPAHQRTSAG